MSFFRRAFERVIRPATRVVRKAAGGIGKRVFKVVKRLPQKAFKYGRKQLRKHLRKVPFLGGFVPGSSGPADESGAEPIPRIPRTPRIQRNRMVIGAGSYGQGARGRSTVTQNLRGSGFIAAINLDSKVPYTRGDVLLDIPINPSEMGVDYLSRHAALYERFSFPVCAFTWTPTCTPLATGSLIAFFTMDDADVIPPEGGDSNVKDASNRSGHVSERVSAPMTCYMPPHRGNEYYILPDTGGSPRFTRMGHFILMAASDISNATDTPLGNVTVGYQCRFEYPRTGPAIGATFKITAGGTQSDADLLGDASVTEPWSTLQVRRTGNVITLPAGCYLFSFENTGTGISQDIWTTDGYIIDGNQSNTSTNDVEFWQINLPTDGTVTIAGHMTTSSACSLTVSILPFNALTTKAKEKLALLKATQACSELKELVKEHSTRAAAPPTEVKVYSAGTATAAAVPPMIQEYEKRISRAPRAPSPAQTRVATTVKIADKAPEGWAMTP